MVEDQAKAADSPARRNAVLCDMCRGLPYALCTYNCPQGAARRGDPKVLFPEVFEAIKLA